MIAFSGFGRENATMVESGLIQKAHPAEVTVGFGTAKSRYVPLLVPRSGDAASVLAVFLVENAPNGPGAAPTQFMMTLGDGAARVDLTSAPYPGGVEAIFDYDAGKLAALVNKLERLNETRHSTNLDAETSGGCQNLVVGYRMFARGADAKWHEYLHGPLTFQCNDTSDTLDKDALNPQRAVGPSPTSRAPDGGHKFDHGKGGGPGGFDGSFLSALSADASFQLESAVVTIEAWDARSQYAAIVVPRGEDVDLLIATVAPETLDDGKSEQPEQFMLILEDDVMRIPLQFSGNEVRWIAPMKDIEDLCVHLVAEPAADQRDGIELYDDCLDILIPYRLFGRKLGEKWIEYAHGPLLFKCSGEGNRRTHAKSRAPYRGPFMTWKSPSFMPQFMSSEGTEA